MKIGYLFPGQGTQTVGMGKDLYEKYEAYRNIYQRANDLTGSVSYTHLDVYKRQEYMKKQKKKKRG